MKVMTNFVKYMMIVLLSLFIFSCSDGEDGARGPAGQDGVDGVGVDGQDGATGQDGVDGQNGTDGEPGTANVIYSDWIPENFDGSRPESAESTDGIYESYTLVSGLSNQIIEEGTILVYGRRNGSLIRPLPYINVDNGEIYNFLLLNGILKAEAKTLDNSNKDFEFFSEFRYIIIPGGVAVPSSATSKSAKDYTSMSYKEVLSMFNIPE